tara:strand:- start:146 stop:331 length:186 start_codon:yes stop_codon:yes gene_type:complete
MANKIHFKFFGISGEAEGPSAIKSLERLFCIGIAAMLILSTLAGTGFLGYVSRLVLRLLLK